MIFKVILNGSRVIYDGNNPTGILDPQLEIELNAAGSFTFTLPSGSDVINDITPFTSEIDVYEDEEMIWFGRVLNKEKVWNNQCKITCEGGLAYFNDSIQDKKTWESTRTENQEGVTYNELIGQYIDGQGNTITNPYAASDGDVTMAIFFRDLIDWHNGQVSDDRQWEVGTIAPEFGLSKIWRETNRETTSDCLQTMCLDTDGGYFITRKEYVIDPTEGRVAKRYIDWVNEMPYGSTQNIEFGVNLLDVSNSINGADICTSLVPIGADELTIYNVPDTGSKESPVDGCYHRKKTYTVIHAASEAVYGRVQKTKTWSDITDKESLYLKAVEYLKEQNTDIPSIECSAAELHYLGGEYKGKSAFRVGQLVRVVSPVHGIIGNYPLLKISMSLNSGAKRVTIGTPPKKELTDIVKNTSGTSSRNTTGGSTGSGSGGSSGGSGYVGVKDVRLKKPGDVEYESTVKNKISKIDLSNMVKDVKLNGTSVVTEGQALLPAYPTIPVEDVLYGGSSLVVNKKAIIPPYPTIPVRDVLQGGSSLVVNGNAIIPPFPTIPVEDVLQGGSSLVVNGKAIIPQFPTIPVTDVLMGGSSLVVNGQAVIPIEPNPEEQTTDDLDSLKIGETVYKLKGSGGSDCTSLSDYYSTEERVIGRWTDGKPLYQKTLDFGSNVTINGNAWYNTSISATNVDKVIHAFAGSNTRVSSSDAYNNSWDFLGCTQEDGTFKILNARNGQITMRYVTIQYTKTTDAPGTGPTPGNLVYLPALYSEEEREVGVWIDGKPVYQKTKVLTGTFSGSMNNISSGLEDVPIDNICYINALGVVSSGTYVNIPHVNRQNGNDNGGFTINPPDYTINLRFTTNWSMNKMIFTYRYTKTTDQAGGASNFITDHMISIPDIYSEEEREVGVWIDGKPLYQKTIYLGTLIRDTSWHYVNHNISDIDTVVSVTGKINNGNSSDLYWYDLPIHRANTNTGITLGAGDTDINYINNWLSPNADCSVNLRYTKTTDEPGSGQFWKNATPTGNLVKDILKNGQSIVGPNGIADLSNNAEVDDVLVNGDSVVSSTDNKARINMGNYIWSVVPKKGVCNNGYSIEHFMTNGVGISWMDNFEFRKCRSYSPNTSTYTNDSNVVGVDDGGVPSKYEYFYLPPILRVMIQYDGADSMGLSSARYDEAKGYVEHQAVIGFTDFSYIDAYTDNTHNQDKYAGCLTGITLDRTWMYDLPHAKYSADIRNDGVWVDGSPIYSITFIVNDTIAGYGGLPITDTSLAQYVEDPILIDSRLTLRRIDTSGNPSYSLSPCSDYDVEVSIRLINNSDWVCYLRNYSSTDRYVHSVTVWYIKTYPISS